jgi:hypothetical protein
MAIEHPELWGAMAFLFLGYIEMRVHFGQKLDRLQLSVQDVRDVVIIKKTAKFRGDKNGMG